MAIVIDEYGGTAGLVTTEELAEEVVGRLTDEWVNEAPLVQTVAGRRVRYRRADPRRRGQRGASASNLPTSPDYETIAGFLLFQLRQIPKQGTRTSTSEARTRQAPVHRHQDGRPEDRARAGGAGVTHRGPACYNRARYKRCATPFTHGALMARDHSHRRHRRATPANSHPRRAGCSSRPARASCSSCASATARASSRPWFSRATSPRRSSRPPSACRSNPR